MNLPTFATLLIAATAAHAAETKQNIRKAEVEGAGHGSYPAYCDINDFTTGPLVQAGQICTIVPDLANQPGAPVGTDGGVFCTSNGYTLTLDATTPNVFASGIGNLLRGTLDLSNFQQNPAPGQLPERKLTEDSIFTPLLDPAVNGGGGIPESIDFQGFFDSDCTFQTVSTQGGQLTGTLNRDTDSVRVQFTQSGQVTSPLTSLPGQFQDDNVVGLFVSNFAFAFKGEFEEVDNGRK